MTKVKSIKEKILKNSRVKKEYQKNIWQFEIAEMVMRARVKRGMTQKKLARLLGTKQPSVARVESGDYGPSIKLLDKIAKALGTELILKFACVENEASESRILQFNYTLPLGDRRDQESNIPVDYFNVGAAK